MQGAIPRLLSLTDLVMKACSKVPDNVNHVTAPVDPTIQDIQWRRLSSLDVVVSELHSPFLVSESATVRPAMRAVTRHAKASRIMHIH